MTEQFYDLPQERQMRIINAALEIFALNDYKHAVTDEIARKAGISKGLLFYYFRNKKELYEFLWDYSARLIKGQIMDGRFPEITDYFELLSYAAEKKAELLRQTPYLMEFVTRCFYTDRDGALSGGEAVTGDFPKGMFLEYFQHVDFGKFRGDVTPMEVYEMLTWMADGYIHDRQRAGKPLVIEELMEVFYLWAERLRRIAYKAEYLTDEDGPQGGNHQGGNHQGGSYQEGSHHG